MRHRAIPLWVVILLLQMHLALAPSRAEASVIRIRAQSTQQDVSKIQTQAERGDADSQIKLARAYETGEGVARNQELAFQWYRKAAEQGNPKAQNRVGEIYRLGEGVEQNKQEAVRWYRKSARQGNGDAMCNLGVAYYNGDGVEANEIISYAWFLLAKDAGCGRAAEAVHRAESEPQAQRLPQAFNFIASMYESGEYLATNETEAARWWLMAAKSGDADAAAALGVKLLEGKGVPQDFNQGRGWCEKAAEKGNARGAYCMGRIYEQGLGTKNDAKKARGWYERGAVAGDRGAMKSLARMEAGGQGGKTDRVSACLRYAQLTLRGDEDSLRTLAELRRAMGPKEWKQVETKLPAIRIDPIKMNALLRQMGAP